MSRTCVASTNLAGLVSVLVIQVRDRHPFDEVSLDDGDLLEAGQPLALQDNAPKEVVLRFRHSMSAPIKGVTVDGKPWTEFNKDKETITLKGLTGAVNVSARY
jgi:hypothetical protein